MLKNTLKFLELYPNAPQILYEMLQNCVGSPEHPIYHPEGTLDKHIDIVIERAMEKNTKELHFAACLHDICKHGHLECISTDAHPYSYQIGRLKEIPEGVYWQNINHAQHAVKFCELPLVSKWILSHGVNLDKVKMIVGNHMRMKNYLTGEKGGKNGMKPSKRDAMKKELELVWEDLYYFSSYCDSMLRPSNQ